MREILFRGKRVDNGEWVEGYYFRQYGSNEIVTADEQYHIVLETRSEYTGCTDKNGTRIFEHDIIKIKYPFDEPCNEAVSWNVEGARWNFGGADAYFANPQKWAEVIGNVFDNPELLKGD